MLSLTKYVLLAAMGLLPLQPRDQRDSGVVLRAVRFYRADQNQTRVKGLVQIPLGSLQPAKEGGQASYTVAVRVADSTGLALYQQSWQSHAGVVADSNAY